MLKKLGDFVNKLGFDWKKFYNLTNDELGNAKNRITELEQELTNIRNDVRKPCSIDYNAAYDLKRDIMCTVGIEQEDGSNDDDAWNNSPRGKA